MGEIPTAISRSDIARQRAPRSLIATVIDRFVITRSFPLVAMLVTVPFAAGAQLGDRPGIPGEPDAGLSDPPAAPGAKCQALLTIRDELEKSGAAIGAARNKKANVNVVCGLFRMYIATHAKMIKMLDADGPACGVPAQINQQVRESHAKVQQNGDKVCDAAAGRPNPLVPSVLGPYHLGPTPRERPWPAGDYWLPTDRFRDR